MTKTKEIEELMEDDEFCENNDAVKNHMTESELLHVQTQWYEPKASYLTSFF